MYQIANSVDGCPGWFWSELGILIYSLNLTLMDYKWKLSSQTRSTRNCGIQWTQPPHDPATRTSCKEPRGPNNVNIVLQPETSTIYLFNSTGHSF
jgi:hypothetical protein